MTRPSGAGVRPAPARPGPVRRMLGGFVVAAVAITVATLALLDPPARFTGTDPADGTVLGAPPSRVAAVFTGGFEPREMHLTVAPAGGGPSVTTGPVRRDGSAITVAVSITATGEYLVGYHVLLADGRELSGITRFTVSGTGPAPAAGGPPAEAEGDGGHVHGGDDPLSLGLLALDLVLLVVVAIVLLRRPRRRDRTAGGGTGPIGA
ncbi:copper resistance CopC family protein [Dactylosporangium sp. McL0621]|uniref:copper resistance CopC family protein n=1 Tax=Dactylosporangium sp. McL0621 TaxID=3415678 RepID=UPI003CF70481